MATSRGKGMEAKAGRLARLPKRGDLVIEGGKRKLGLYYRHGKALFQPELVLWVDAASGYVRASAETAPHEEVDGGIARAIDALMDACLSPIKVPTAAMLDTLSPRLRGRSSPSGVTGALPGEQQRPSPAERGLPATVRVEDAALAAAAAALLEPLGVAVEQVAQVSAFDEAYQSMARLMGAEEDAEPPKPFGWEIDVEMLPPLFKAAARFARYEPWQYLPDNPPLVVQLGKNGPAPDVETLYASILGAGGQVYGVAFYYSLDEYRSAYEKGEELEIADDDAEGMIAMLRGMGAPVDGIPPEELRDLVRDVMAGGPPTRQEVAASVQDSLAVFIEATADSDPTYLDWLTAHGVTLRPAGQAPSFLRTVKGSEVRPPDQRETRALTLALDALNGFLKEFREYLEAGYLPVEPVATTVQIGSGKARQTVDVQYPPPGFEWSAEILNPDDEFDEDDDELDDEDEDDGDGNEEGDPLVAPSPSAATTVYRFQVKLAWRRSVWRRIEVRADQTLHNLHNAIQEAFNWDNDHLYAFFLSGRAWDERSEFGSPFGEGRSAANYYLEHLPLRVGQQFLYIFDFGDELQHLVTLEAVTPGAVEPDAAYPRIVERHGASVRQY